MKTIKVILCIMLASCLSLLSGCQGGQSKEKAVQETVEGYLTALPTHDVQEIKKYVNEDWQKNLSNEDYVTAFVDTVVSCESIDVDVEQIKEIGDNEVEVPVKYVLTYSENYFPVGTLEIGENEMDYIFTLEQQEDGQYVIAHMRSALEQ